MQSLCAAIVEYVCEWRRSGRRGERVWEEEKEEGEEAEDGRVEIEERGRRGDKEREGRRRITEERIIV